MATVSIIVPVYNKESTINSCVDSILKQSFQDFEIILIDDGSTDQSLEKCNQLAKQTDKIKIFHQSNKGVSTARNYGIRESKSEYLSFVDADDSLEVNFIEKMMECFNKEDVDIAICTCYAIVDGKQVRQHFFHESFCSGNDYFSKKELYMQLMDTNYNQELPAYTGVGVPWGKIYRSSLLNEFSLNFNESLKHYEDNLFNLEAFYYANSICYIDEPLYNYSTAHITKVLAKYDRDIVESYLRIYGYRLEYLKDKKIF